MSERNRVRTALINGRKAWRRLFPTAIVCHELKLLYFSIPKVASSTVKRYLMEHGYEKGRMSAEDITMGVIHGYPFPRVTASEIRRLDCYTSFCVSRDPYARIWSCYVDKVLKNRESGRQLHPGFQRYNHLFGRRMFDLQMEFSAFLKSVAKIPDWMADGHFRSQHRFLIRRGGQLVVDKVIPIERLDDGMTAFLRERNLPEWRTSNVNPSKASQLKPHWSAESIELVNRRYGVDLKLLDYPLKSDAE